MGSIDGLGGDGDAVGAALDQVAAAVGGGDEEEVGAGGVDDEDLLAVEDDAVAVGLGLHREAAGRRRASRRPRAPACRAARPRPAAAGSARAGRRSRRGSSARPAIVLEKQRRGGERVAHLLEEDGELDDAEALSAPLLGQRQAGPAELGHLVPVGCVEAVVAGGELADPLGFEARGEEVVGGRLDRLLLVGEVEVHGRSLAQPRQAEHALGDDVLEDVGGAALDRVGARAQEAVLPGAVGDRVLGAAGERRVGALDLQRQLGQVAG